MPQRVLAAPKPCLTSARVGGIYAETRLHLWEQRQGQAGWKHQDTTLRQPVLVITQHHKEKAEKQTLQGKTRSKRASPSFFLGVGLGRLGGGSWLPVCDQFGGGEADLPPVSCRRRVLVRALPA